MQMFKAVWVERLVPARVVPGVVSQTRFSTSTSMDMHPETVTVTKVIPMSFRAPVKSVAMTSIRTVMARTCPVQMPTTMVTGFHRPMVIATTTIRVVDRASLRPAMTTSTRIVMVKISVATMWMMTAMV